MHKTPATPDMDVAVISIAREVMPPAFKFLVQFVQEDVGQKRRERPSLWSALGRGNLSVPITDTRFQDGIDESLDPLVLDLPAQTGHEYVMIHFVE